MPVRACCADCGLGRMRYTRDAGFCRGMPGGAGAGYIFLPAGRYYTYSAENSAKEEKRGIEVDKHPIESLMGTSMESIREMVDVNTVVRDT